MQSVVRAAMLLAAFLAIPIVPFLFLGESFETQVTSWIHQEDALAGQIGAAAVVGILASDIFLPIPASAVITYAGGVMGVWSATMTSWIGLSVGACLGFGLSKWLGKAFARRFADPEDLKKVEVAAERFGPQILLLTRPLPILAESCVLLMGTTRLGWREFLLPVVSANLVISLIYASCGALFEEQKPLMIAAVASGTLPLLLALSIRRRMQRARTTDSDVVSNELND